MTEQLLKMFAELLKITSPYISSLNTWNNFVIYVIPLFLFLAALIYSLIAQKTEALTCIVPFSVLATFIPHMIFIYLQRNLTSLNLWIIHCIALFVIWWIVYFWFYRRVPNLRSFLDKYSIFRGERYLERVGTVTFRDIRESWQNKSRSSIMTYSIFIAIIGVFLATILSKEPQKPRFDVFLYWTTIIVGLGVVILFIVSVDTLETINNLFLRSRSGGRTNVVKQDLFFKHYFTQMHVSYYAVAAFILFIILSATHMNPHLCGLSVALFILAGYSYWFDDLVERYNPSITEQEKLSTLEQLRPPNRIWKWIFALTYFCISVYLWYQISGYNYLWPKFC